MSENLIQVRGAVIDTAHLTLYKTDGTKVSIPQGDVRIAPITKQIIPIIKLGQIATVDLGDDPTSQPIDLTPKYAEFEKQSKWTKFFRVAKAVVFGTKEAEAPAGELVPPCEIMPPTVHGSIPVKILVDDVGVAETMKIVNAVDEIMKHATPASDSKFTDEGTHEVNSVDTVIAVHTNEKTGARTVIPGVQDLRKQIDHAAKLGSTKAVDAFLSRLAPVVSQRRHSVDDLLNFMKKNDLPIAEDGCVIGYKALDHHPKQDGYYVDKHSRKVPQRIGSFVFMKPELVDPNRRNECSNGLHVARRAYMRGFGGDACFLIKIKPEDVIAVPEYDANKMRVCGYHLIFQLSEADHKLITEDKNFTGTKEGRTLLGRAIAGDHPPIDQLVEIRGPMGGDVLVTDLKPGLAAPDPLPITLPPVTVKPVAAIKLDGDAEVGPVLDGPVLVPAAVAKTIAVVKAKVVVSQRQATAQAMFEKVAKAKPGSQTQFGAARALIDFKRAAKVGWDKLGMTNEAGEDLQRIVNPVAAVKTAPAPEPAAPVKMADPATFKPTSLAPKSKDAAEALVKIRQTKVTPAPVPTTSLSKGQQALLLYGDVMGLTGQRQKKAAQELLDLKKASKKSWTALGFTRDPGLLLQTILK